MQVRRARSRSGLTQGPEVARPRTRSRTPAGIESESLSILHRPAERRLRRPTYTFGSQGTYDIPETLQDTRNWAMVTAGHSYYQPYYKNAHLVTDVIRLFAGYSRNRARLEMLSTRRRARQRTIYDAMDKDAQKTLTRVPTTRSHVHFSGGHKVETLVRPDVYDLSRRNLGTLEQILGHLRLQHQRSLGLH